MKFVGGSIKSDVKRSCNFSFLNILCENDAIMKFVTFFCSST